MAHRRGKQQGPDPGVGTWSDQRPSAVMLIPVPVTPCGTCGLVADLDHIESEIRGPCALGGGGMRGAVSWGSLCAGLGGSRAAQHPSASITGGGLPTSCAPGGILSIPRAGPGVPPCPSTRPTRVGQMWPFPGGMESVIRGAMGLRSPCAHSVGQSPHVPGRRGHPKVPGSADTIRGASGPTAAPLVSTTMLGAVCLVLLLGYGGCRAWGRVWAGGTGPWGLARALGTGTGSP